jgi:hypothetical protein
MAILDNVFTPVSPIVANCNIGILWSHGLNEKDAREANNGIWSPNHFVPLISPGIHNDSNNGNQSTSITVVSYSSVNENSIIWKFFFRLLKRKHLRIMLLLKYEFRNFNLLLADVYEVNKTAEVISLNQLFQVQFKRKRMTKNNNVKYNLKRKENEVDRVEWMKQKNNARFDSRRKENEVDPVEQMTQKNNVRFDLKRKETKLDLVEQMKQKNNVRFDLRRKETKLDLVEQMKQKNNVRFNLGRKETKLDLVEQMKQNNNVRFDLRRKENELDPVEQMK